MSENSLIDMTETLSEFFLLEENYTQGGIFSPPVLHVYMSVEEQNRYPDL